MKRILAFTLLLIMSFTLLIGCSDPVFDDLENFVNVEMKDVNANYKKITAEIEKWKDLEDYADIASNISDTLLPLANESIEKLNAVNPKTDDVKELKDQYVKIMEAYKNGLSDILTGIQEEDEAKLSEGTGKIDDGLKMVNEYNAALEALAKEVGAKIEY